jgi:integrase/recombinase XerD
MSFKGKRHADRFIEVDEFKLLAKAAKDDSELSTIFRLMGIGGLRTIEVADLTVKSLDRQKRGLWVDTAKQTNDPITRFVPLDDRSFEALSVWAKGKRPEAHLVNHAGTPVTRRRIRYLFHLYKRKAGIREELGPHSLRHLAGIVRTEQGASPQEVAAFLGHKTLNMVLVYANLREGRNRELTTDAVRRLTDDTNR